MPGSVLDLVRPVFAEEAIARWAEEGRVASGELARVVESHDLSSAEWDALCQDLGDLAIRVVDAASEAQQDAAHDGDLDCEALFWRTARQHDVLNPRREAALARRAATGDEAARALLVASNLRLVASLARRYRVQSGLDFLDLMQEGTLGLINAIDRFDPARGHKLSTYATWWIRKTLFQAMADKGRTIRIPLHRVLELNRMLRVERELTQRLGRTADDAEIADAMKVPVERVRELRRIDRFTTPLDVENGDNGRPLADVLADRTAPAPPDVLERNHQADVLRTALERLAEPERAVLRWRFGLEDGREWTVAQIARRLGLSRQRVHQIEQGALERLRVLPESQALKLAS